MRLYYLVVASVSGVEKETSDEVGVGAGGVRNTESSSSSIRWGVVSNLGVIVMIMVMMVIIMMVIIMMVGMTMMMMTMMMMMMVISPSCGDSVRVI